MKARTEPTPEGSAVPNEGRSSMNKQRLNHTEWQRWMSSFNELKAMPEGARVEYQGEVYEFSHVYDSPHPPSAWFRKVNGNHRDMCAIYLGEKSIYELKPISR